MLFRSVTISCILLFVFAASASADCPSNSLRDKSADYARTLATKGFDLTDYDLYINRPVLTLEETCIKPTPDEAVACNDAFRSEYRAGLLKMGKTEPEINEWFEKAFIGGQLAAPRKACGN